MKRLFLSVVVGLCVTLALFGLMQAMVMDNQKGFQKTDNLRMVEFVRLKREAKPKVNERRTVKKPPPPEKRPPPPQMQMQQTQVQQAAQPDLNMPNLDIPITGDRFKGSITSNVSVAAGVSGTGGVPGVGVGQGFGGVSTDIIPLVRIPPRYPMRAANRHIEGSVTVEFTIAKDGTVADARVIEAHPSSIFNRAALEALQKWKFKPKIVEGQAVEQQARQTLQFKLSK
ncbi:MAG: energy transducer TonB [Gammaproteobacteria bacterium]